MTDKAAIPTAGFTIKNSGSSLNGIVGAGSGLAIAAYLIAVTFQGNLDQLGAMLLKEESYLEFALAIIILWALNKYGPTSPITDLLMTGTVIAVILRISAKINLSSITSNFASGNASMVQTVQAIVGAL